MAAAAKRVQPTNFTHRYTPTCKSHENRLKIMILLTHEHDLKKQHKNPFTKQQKVENSIFK